MLGHEVVAEVAALGPEAEGLEIGQRVVLNPWLSCGPRGVSPECGACEAGDLSLCWNFLAPPIADLTAMLTHLRPLKDWRGAFDVLADQAASGAIKVAFDQRT